MAQIMTVQGKQVVGRQAIIDQQYLPQQTGTRYVIDQGSVQLPKIRIEDDQLWVLWEEESLLLDASNSAELFVQTPGQNYQLVSGQWQAVAGEPWLAVPATEPAAENMVASLSEPASGLSVAQWGMIGAGTLLAGGWALNRWDDDDAMVNISEPSAPLNQAASIVLSGKTEVGSVLSATVSDGDGLPGSIQYQWYADGQAIAGATGARYTLTAAETGKVMTVRAVFTDLAGHQEQPLSAQSSVVTAPAATNQAPTDLRLSDTSLPENQAGVAIGQLSVVDPDAGDQHRFTVSDNRFEVVNGYLKLKAGQKVDYAQEQSIHLTITATDQGGLQVRKTVTLTVQDDPNYPIVNPNNQAASIVLRGKTEVGSVLSATVSDGDGLPGSIQYQWYADGQAIAGATGARYTLTAAETGKVMTVRAVFTDLAGHQEQPLSAQSSVVTAPAATNQAPTDLSLSDTSLPENQAGVAIGQLSVVDPDAGDQHRFTVSDNRFEVVNGYLKLKAGQKVDYAQEQSIHLTITATDQGGLQVRKTVTLTVQDDPNYPIVNPNNQAASIVLSGKTEVGSVLSATVSDGDGLPGSIQYQWYADGQAIAGATGARYTLTAAETGKVMTVRAVFTDLAGHQEQPLSAQSSVVTAPAATNRAPTDLSLSDTSLPENQAGVAIGQLSVVDPDAGDQHRFTVSDNRFEVVNGYLKLKAGQKVDYAQEQSIHLTITATDRGGLQVQKTVILTVTDDPAYPVAPPANQPGNVLIEGDLRSGQTLTAKLSDPNGVPANGVRYQWYSGNEAINGANSATYLLTDSERYKTISVSAVYTDDDGYAESVAATSTANVRHAGDNGTNQVSTIEVRGEMKVGSTLRAVLHDPDGLPADGIVYQWYADYQKIDGATGAEYTLTAAELGKNMRVSAIFRDQLNHYEGPYSPATLNVVAADAVPPPLVERGSGAEGGGFAVIPQPTAERAELRYTDEQGATHVVVWQQQNGRWQALGELPPGLVLDAESGKLSVHPESVRDRANAEANNTINGLQSDNLSFWVGDDAVAYQLPALPQFVAGDYHSDWGSAIGNLQIKPAANTDVLVVRYTDERGAQQVITVRKQSATQWVTEPELPQFGWDDTPVYYNVETGALYFQADTLADGTVVTAEAQNKTSGVSVTGTYHAPYDAAMAPKYEAGNADALPGQPEPGALRITPDEDTDRMLVRYTDEQDVQREITVVKNGSGTWHALAPLPVGVVLDSSSGVVLLTPDSVKDYSTVVTETGNVHTNVVTRAYTTVGQDLFVPQSPQIAAGSQQGSVVITPDLTAGNATVRLQISFTDEQGQLRQLTAKQAFDFALPNFPLVWQLYAGDDVQPLVQGQDGLYIDALSGVVSLAPDAVRDGSQVSVQAYNAYWPNHPSPVTTWTAGQDAATPPLLLSLSGSARVEEGQAATYTVSLNQAAATDVRVAVTVTAADATKKALLSASTQIVTIAAGETSAQFSVQTGDDGESYQGYDYRVSLSDAEGALLDFDHSVQTQVSNTTPSPPVLETVYYGEHQGAVQVRLDKSSDQVTVRFTDEQDRSQQVVLKQSNGQWSSETALPEYVSIGRELVSGLDAQNNYLILLPNSVQDYSMVYARQYVGTVASAESMVEAYEDRMVAGGAPLLNSNLAASGVLETTVLLPGSEQPAVAATVPVAAESAPQYAGAASIGGPTMPLEESLAGQGVL